MFEKIYGQAMVEGEPLPFALPAWLALAPFEEYLGMRIETAADGRALLSMPFTVAHAQGWGLMHGGAVTALADTAVAIAMKTLLPEGSKFATVEMGLVFHAPVRGGSVRAEARVVERQERTLRGEAEVFDSHGSKVASFHATFKVKRQG
ncbi:MAG TPA: PaaI family thioesterase [Geobacterales bacterium]|nr:PaaI family thioesterase [Geobacterales bacterium]